MKKGPRSDQSYKAQEGLCGAFVSVLCGSALGPIFMAAESSSRAATLACMQGIDDPAHGLVSLEGFII